MITHYDRVLSIRGGEDAERDIPRIVIELRRDARRLIVQRIDGFVVLEQEFVGRVRVVRVIRYGPLDPAEIGQAYRVIALPLNCSEGRGVYRRLCAIPPPP